MQQSKKQKQLREFIGQSKPTVHTPAEAKELEDMGRGKVINESVDNDGKSGIIKPDTLKMAASQQKPLDFSKYEVKADLEAVENMRGRISESMGIPLSDIDLDGIQMHILPNMKQHISEFLLLILKMKRHLQYSAKQLEKGFVKMIKIFMNSLRIVLQQTEQVITTVRCKKQ